MMSSTKQLPHDASGFRLRSPSSSDLPILGSERFCIETGASDVATVFNAVFGQGGSNLPISTEPGDNVEVLDELSLNESVHYKEKITKYIKTTVQCVRDATFWFFMHAGNEMRSPLLHFYAYLCKPESQSTGLVVDLVAFKISTFSAEFDDLFRNFVNHVGMAAQFARSIPESGLCVQDTALWGDWTTGLLAILLHNAGAFNRRVTRYFNRHRHL